MFDKSSLPGDRIRIKHIGAMSIEAEKPATFLLPKYINK